MTTTYPGTDYTYPAWTPQTILLQVRERHIEEALAGGAIKPGMLVEENSDGEVIVHATAGGKAILMFALEDALQGKTIDDAYAEGDRVNYHIAEEGDYIYAFLKNGENVTKADKLMSAGDGTFKKYTDATKTLSGNGETITVVPNCKLVQAEETINATAASAPVRIRVKVLD